MTNRNEYYKEYRRKNKESIKEKSKEFREANKELVKQRKKAYYDNLSDEEKNRIKEKKKQNYYDNIEKYRKRKREYVAERMEEDPLFKLKFNLRTLIRNSLNREFTIKSKKTIEILGCSFEEFYKHLESKFDENMNWDNQGSYWHIDHIKPISLAKNEKEVYELNHYTNFQPLYWEDNLAKSNKFEEEI